MRKIRFLVWLGQAFFQRHFFLILVGVFLGIAAFFFSQKISLLFPQRKVEKIGLVGRFTQEEIPDEIETLVSLGLTRILPDGTATASLAKSWEVDKEGKVFKFYLNDNVFWQDKTRFTAKDVQLNLKDAKVETVSDFQLKITMSEPFSPLPGLVSFPLFKKGLIGTGSYQIAKAEKSGRFLRSITLYPVRDNNLPVLFYRFYNTEEMARVGFKLGEVEKLLGMTSKDDFTAWPRVKIEENVRRNRYVAVFFNTKKEGLEKKSFRQALAYALNKEEGERRALGPIAPDSWAFNPELKIYEQDLSHAKELLGKDNTKAEIELLTFPSLLGVAGKISKDWEGLGIKTTIKVINVLPADFEALLATQEVPADPDQYFLWHSTQSSNLTGLTSPKIDKLLEEGRKTLDTAKRVEIYRDFQKTLVEECPAIFLFHPVTYTISR